ncbi:hypothetical protein [Umezawaea beigongshangensis]|uniref:hypothetical protein n=1 Tax=Umezawaea beigongshangensis TaxID=2780383 RepID=UPI0018F12F79|nr:hypothetical protein [Umezawaea beigongshangensis]
MDGEWWVLIDEVRGFGDGRERTLSHTERAGSREAASALALDLAHRYVPAYPWALRSRQVFRVAPDSYVVVAHGHTSTFDFQVRVGELLAEE